MAWRTAVTQNTIYSERTTVILVMRDRRWAQTAKHKGDKICKHFYGIHEKSVVSANMLEVSLLGVEMDGAPSRKGCVVNGQITKASD